MDNYTTPTPSAEAVSANPIDDYALDRIDYRVRDLMFRFDLSFEDQDDLRNDMAVEILKAFDRFDPTKSKRETFINRVLNRFILDRMRRWCTNRRRVSDSPLAFYDVNPRFDPCINDPGQGEPDEQSRHDMRIDVPTVVAELPEELQRVCQVLSQTHGHEAAKELGINRFKLHRNIEAIRTHFVQRGYGKIFAKSSHTLTLAADVESTGKESKVTQ